MADDDSNSDKNGKPTNGFARLVTQIRKARQSLSTELEEVGRFWDAILAAFKRFAENKEPWR